MHCNFGPSNRALNPILAPKDLSKFFKRTAFSFYKEEVNKCKLKAVLENEQEIVFLASAAKRDSCNEDRSLQC